MVKVFPTLKVKFLPTNEDGTDSFYDKFKFQITVESKENLDKDICVKAVYITDPVGKYDQTLEDVEVGPIKKAKSTFVLETDAPKIERVVATDVSETHIIAVSASIKEEDKDVMFYRASFFVANDIVGKGGKIQEVNEDEISADELTEEEEGEEQEEESLEDSLIDEDAEIEGGDEEGDDEEGHIIDDSEDEEEEEEEPAEPSPKRAPEADMEVKGQAKKMPESKGDTETGVTMASRDAFPTLIRRVQTKPHVRTFD
ncbi:histone chaperone, ASF1-like [Kipferlia bialata]|uniref:Histone chaperone, ASF1-like n=1 Tax=Kipferlia bialata TaxID=797122 RepID=A0A9K3CT43_9EUKA|nr:histone chaperone, ASF1-like [Kipferlia bialata]|eukprot:g2120.t1